MNYLSKNISHLERSRGQEVSSLLNKLGCNDINSLPINKLAIFCNELGVQLENFVLFPMDIDRKKLDRIKFLILDIDGVMTDAGMYFTENGDQFKKYNAKDGMAIMALTRKDFQVGIISSGFKLEMVKSRAELLNIQHLYVGRDSKIEILQKWCEKLNITFEEVAIIGDDINDLSIMQKVGLAVCPSDAVTKVKQQAHLVLQTPGGKGCVREFIDNYLLTDPV